MLNFVPPGLFLPLGWAEGMLVEDSPSPKICPKSLILYCDKKKRIT